MKWEQIKKVNRTTKKNDRWDSLIKYWVEYHSGEYISSENKKELTSIPWKLIKYQIQQESGFDPKAKSQVGAKGLLQLMPRTDMEIDNDLDEFDCDGNLDNGIQYLVTQYLHLLEIPNIEQRWQFSLAAYNCGRGFINKALQLARENNESNWQNWKVSLEYLKSPLCNINGITPRYEETIHYVNTIWGNYIKE